MKTFISEPHRGTIYILEPSRHQAGRMHNRPPNITSGGRERRREAP
jgi:hypothetical protein